MKTGWSRSFSLGAVAFIFLVIGYQSALFIHKAAVARIVAESVRDSVVADGTEGTHEAAGVAERAVGLRGSDVAREENAKALENKDLARGAGVSREQFETGSGGGSEGLSREQKKEEVRKEIVRNFRPREEFRFNPNTVSAGELERLGFSEKQAASIVAYREKGGRFNRPEDFARSYVVSDEMFARLEKWIDIPLLNINEADSAAFDALPGIGPAFARRMVAYRESLGGLYSSPDQLLEIYNFDEERYSKIRDLITVAYPSCSRPVAGASSGTAGPGSASSSGSSSAASGAATPASPSAASAGSTAGSSAGSSASGAAAPADTIPAPLLDPLPVLRLWSAPEDSLRRHPYIGSWKTAHAIQLYKASAPRSDWSLDGLVRAGVLTPELATRLSRHYRLE